MVIESLTGFNGLLTIWLLKVMKLKKKKDIVKEIKKMLLVSHLLKKKKKNIK